MGDDAAIVATTAADGASCIVFVRLLEQVLAFTTQLDAHGHKIDGKVLPLDLVGGKPTLLLQAGYGSDEEADILVGDSQGTAVVVDTRTLEEPTRLTHVSFFDILPSLLDFVFVTIQISAFSFLARNRVHWNEWAKPIRCVYSTRAQSAASLCEPSILTPSPYVCHRAAVLLPSERSFA